MAARPQAARTARILRGGSEQREAEKRRVFDRVFTELWLPVTRHVECYVGLDAEVYEAVAEAFQLAWERLKPSRPPGLPALLRFADSVLSGRKDVMQEHAADEVRKNVVTSQERASTLDPQDVLRAVAQLRGRERRIIVLTYWDGLSTEEVAEVLRSRPGAVRASLRRARKKLRDALEVDRSGDVAG